MEKFREFRKSYQTFRAVTKRIFINYHNISQQSNGLPKKIKNALFLLGCYFELPPVFNFSKRNSNGIMKHDMMGTSKLHVSFLALLTESNRIPSSQSLFDHWLLKALGLKI